MDEWIAAIIQRYAPENHRTAQMFTDFNAVTTAIGDAPMTLVTQDELNITFPDRFGIITCFTDITPYFIDQIINWITKNCEADTLVMLAVHAMYSSLIDQIQQQLPSYFITFATDENHLLITMKMQEINDVIE